MSTKRWIISDIAKKTGIEAHVLRYWEKELDLDIPRNEMGHRYYLDSHVELFKKIHELKESGYQLKAIKHVINNEGVIDLDPPNSDKNNVIEMPVQMLRQVADTEIAASFPEHTESTMIDDYCSAGVQNPTMKQVKVSVSKEDKLEQFKQLLGEVMLDTINRRDEEIGIQISDRIIKQMDYLLRMQEELEDERFKRLDETIRNTQKDRQENKSNAKRKKKAWFGKGSKTVTS